MRKTYSGQQHVDSNEKRRTGWYVDYPQQRGHYCFPPKAYPGGVGPGTKWQCPDRTCGVTWVSEGIQLVDGTDYPVGHDRRDAVMGPERWLHWSTNPGGATFAQGQEALYDWRPLAPYYVRLWRAQLEAMNVDWKAL